MRAAFNASCIGAAIYIGPMPEHRRVSARISRWDADDRRLRGRQGQRERKRRLAQEPLCRHCKEKGKITASTVPDHIVPLAYGGADTDDNIQCLCVQCDAIKTALEDASHGGAATHPDWLRPSAIPLAILCGPPCSGKTTYIAERAHPSDLIIDIDSIAKKLEPKYQHWQGMLSGGLLNRAIRARNAMLGSLARLTSGKAWFIVSAPTKAERDWWHSRLGGEIILLHPGVDECKRRAIDRGTPRAINGIDAWERSSRQAWQPHVPRKKVTIGVDGWPTNR